MRRVQARPEELVKGFARLTRLAVLFFVLFCKPYVCGAATNVSGVLTQSSTWTTSNSPYVVTGNILVSSGVTLTIEPGTRITFQSGTFLQINGTLIADGNASALIVFTSAQNSPAAGDWGPIFLTSSSVGATVSGSDYVSGSVFRYAQIEYGRGIGLRDAYPYLSDNTFYKNAGNGEGCTGPAVLNWNGSGSTPGTLVIKNNLFDRNEASAFEVYSLGFGNLQVRPVSVISNQFFNNVGLAVTLCAEAFSSNEIISNLMSGNHSGIYLAHANEVTITNNTIRGAIVPFTAGVGVDIYSGSPRIENNLFHDNKCPNPRCAIINIRSGGQPTVINNTFLRNQIAALFDFQDNGGGTYNGNNLSGNQVQFVFRRDPASPLGANATGNYWGTTDTNVISALIYDFYDDFSPGIITFSPVLDAPNPAAPPLKPRGQIISQ
jgi:parallel beta-helix repeat protein